MTAILGLSAFYHDSAAALVVDGRIVAAAQEERFSRKKHDASFPTGAVDYCLAAAGLTPSDLDWVGFYDKPLLKFERLLETYLAYAPRGFRSFRQAIPDWLRTKLFLPKVMARGLNGYRRRFVFAEHHESHAASAYFPSPFEEAAILTVDGVGEWTTASFGMGQGHRIALTHQLRFPHSLGLLYSAMAYYLGFRVNSGEHKVMGLAPYGRPVYADLFFKHLLDLKDDGSFRMGMSYFNYAQGLTMTSAKFHRLFGGPPRRPEAPVTQREMDLAASLQTVTEEILLRMVRHVHKTTGAKNLCLAGGVALNCVANGRILREGPFDDLWIQPAAGDAGGALGIALFIEHQLLGHPRNPQPTDSQQGSLLGPGFSDDTIERFLQQQGTEYTRYESDEDLCAAVAEALAGGQVAGWFQGRMEFGPRALGDRSLLGDPRNPEMQAVMNLKVKFREAFRPFGPAVLHDRAAERFEIQQGHESPYMLLTFPVRSDAELAAVTHVDRSARIQTVDPGRNPLFHQLLRTFESQTGCPALINTSFNVRGEPVVCTPADAYRGFLATHIDLLALGRCVVRKAGQRPLTEAEVVAHLAQFPLD
ncbi:carbamoyltransferase [Singulisphaera sp. Ch08]|uniref:Carbamoyltransferase n=1 Tax=Singulisphaera sp. Ch08 TaxID=3120278 RepID=A0AAU7CMJ6_9BACT